MKNVFLYFSAFVPMYALVLMKFVVGTIAKTIDFTPLTVITFIIFSMLTVLGIVGLVWNMKAKAENQIKIEIIVESTLLSFDFVAKAMKTNIGVSDVINSMS